MVVKDFMSQIDATQNEYGTRFEGGVAPSLEGSNPSPGRQGTRVQTPHLAHPNRSRARKESGGAGCTMCKPYKHKWAHRFKIKERVKREDL